MTPDELTGRAVRVAFDDVIPRFHNVNRVVNPDGLMFRFFVDERKQGHRIKITDELYRLRETISFRDLPDEIEARWRLV